MLIKRINRASAEQVFVVVKNNDTTTLSTGRAVVFDYDKAVTTGNTTALVDGGGYKVRFPNTTATQLDAPGQFAGIVAGRDIQVGDFGSVLAYGPIDNVVVSYNTDYFYTNHLSTTTRNTASSWTDVILRPMGCCQITESITGAQSGYVAPLQVSSTVNLTAGAAVAVDLKPFLPGGYLNLIQMNVSFTTGSATAKCFVRAL